MIFHPDLQFEGTTGHCSCIRICIVDVKMQMQGEWPCPKALKRGPFVNKGSILGLPPSVGPIFVASHDMRALASVNPFDRFRLLDSKGNGWFRWHLHKKPCHDA
jgi:hypothetical protein